MLLGLSAVSWEASSAVGRGSRLVGGEPRLRAALWWDLMMRAVLSRSCLLHVVSRLNDIVSELVVVDES